MDRGSGIASVPVFFFDIGNVLVAFDEFEVARQAAGHSKINPLLAARFFLNSPLVDLVERGKISPQELYESFRDQLGFEESFEVFREVWCGSFKADRKSLALYAAVAERYRVYLLSNTNELHYEHISSRYQFPQKASGVILSHRVGLRKPEAAIFEKALQAAGVSPKEAVFIDDRPENVAAAKKLGITAIRFKNAEDLRRELAALGLID